MVSCAPSTPRAARCSGRSRPAPRSHPPRRSTNWTARSTWRSPAAAPSPTPTAASGRSSRSSRSEATRPGRPHAGLHPRLPGRDDREPGGRHHFGHAVLLVRCRQDGQVRLALRRPRTRRRRHVGHARDRSRRSGAVDHARRQDDHARAPVARQPAGCPPGGGHPAPKPGAKMNRIANRYHRLAIASVAAALVLAGCAGDDGDEAPGANPNATIETGDRFEVERWRGEGDNTQTARGRVLLEGRPVANVGLHVNAYRLRSDDDGRFSYRVANGLARRYRISVDDAAAATIDGDELGSAERAALLEAQGAITVAYRLSELEVEPRPNATIVIRGRLTARDGTPPAPAALFSYQLSGRVFDAAGRPRANAVVLTQTLDREGSTFSTPTDARGRYRSFYWPRGDEQVTLSVAEG